MSGEEKREGLPTVCIVGRTNVGKSTLFNAFVGRRTAVVKDSPGVTRDRCYEVVNRFSFPFTLIDTGALVGEEAISLHRAVREQSELAMKQSDAVIVVFDGMHGLHPLDAEVVQLVRQIDKPVIWVANKCEKPSSALVATELYGLGIEEILTISAAHRRGIRDVIAKLEEILKPMSSMPVYKIPTPEQVYSENEDDFEGFDPALVTEIPEYFDENDGEDNPDINPTINLAILGKPNVGKSTFVNKLLGEERMIVSPIAGTTRDSIRNNLSRDGQQFVIVDTAGLRKKAGVEEDSIERFSNIRTLRSLAQCNVAVFLLDASEGLPTEQDARIVGLAHEKGKSLVIVVNKWDLIEKDSRTAEGYRQAVRSVFKFAQYAPVIFVSALTGQRCFAVLDEVVKVHREGKIRLSTAKANKLFAEAFRMRPPPVYRGAPVKLLYATQVASEPPTFAVFVNYPERLNYTYERYLKNTVRKSHPFSGNDVRIIFRRRSQMSNDKRRANG